MSVLNLFSIEHHSSSGSSSHSNDDHLLNHAPSAIELDEMPIGGQAVYQGPLSRPKSAITRASTYHEVDRAVPTAEDDASPSKTPAQLETSRPPSPVQAAEVIQTWRSPSMNRWRILSACLFCLANGCNDSAVSETTSAQMATTDKSSRVLSCPTLKSTTTLATLWCLPSSLPMLLASFLRRSLYTPWTRSSAGRRRRCSVIWFSWLAILLV